MIEVVDVCKKYGEKTILKNISLRIKDGEFIVLSGPSGCGKTTFLHIIGGIEPPTSGRVLVDGKDISIRKNMKEYLKYRVAFLFQNFALVDKKTVRQNLQLIPKESKSDITITEALSYVGMLGFEEEKVYTLSGGEQQRIAIARVLMKKSDIILADEPTGSLDRKSADRVMQLLLRLNEEGKTIILVTHMEEYRRMGTRVVDLMSF